RQHLRHRPRVDPEPTCRLPPTHPLHIHRSPHLPVQFHAFHPSALCPSWQKTFCCRTFAPALRPVYQAASLRDFFTGALTRPSSKRFLGKESRIDESGRSIIFHCSSMLMSTAATTVRSSSFPPTPDSSE